MEEITYTQSPGQVTANNELLSENSYIQQDELNEKDQEIAELRISDPYEYEKLLAQDELVDED